MSSEKDTLRPEYDPELIRSGKRGKYSEAFRRDTNIIVLEPDLQKMFPDSAAVNRALREYVEQHKPGSA